MGICEIGRGRGAFCGAFGFFGNEDVPAIGKCWRELCGWDFGEEGSVSMLSLVVWDASALLGLRRCKSGLHDGGCHRHREQAQILSQRTASAAAHPEAVRCRGERQRTASARAVLNSSHRITPVVFNAAGS